MSRSLHQGLPPDEPLNAKVRRTDCGRTQLLQIRANVTSVSRGEHDDGCRVTLTTNDRTHVLAVEQKSDGRGLATNGGELLCMALATCFCNDVYREASPRGIAVDQVEIVVRSVFGAAGEPAQAITYQVRVVADATPSAIRALVEHTDTMAEVHNTLRRGMPVTLTAVDVASRGDRGSDETST